jgi:hypothetical protein
VLKSIKNFFTGPDPSAKSQIVVPVRGQIPKAHFAAVGVRAGMWVMTKEGVGVVKGVQSQVQQGPIQAQTWVDVDLTDKDGFTFTNLLCDPNSVRIAALSEIPPNRMKIDVEQAARLGYL